MTESSSTLLGNMGVIVLVWFTVLCIAQIVKVAAVKSLAKAGEKAQAAAESRVRKGVAIFCIVATALAAIALLVFALFLNNASVKDPEQVDRIQQAPLPEDFKPPTKEDIAKSNEEAVTEKADQVRKEATEDNTKAMNESIEMFRKAGSGKEEE